jgi:hypothetical protein
MSRPPRRHRMILCLLALAMTACRAAEPSAPQAQKSDRPELAILTTLPIVFGEGFGLDTPAHPVLTALSQDFRIRPIDGPDELPPGGLLLAAQPRALTAQRLVALDAWVRAGGRLLLLADPRLAWPSERPLGDRFRPPFAFDDTGLLVHWGLRLSFTDTPAVPRTLGKRRVTGSSPGTLASSTGACVITDGGWRADCRLGKGRAVVIADADWLDPRQWSDDSAGPEQLGALTDQLDSLAG